MVIVKENIESSLNTSTQKNENTGFKYIEECTVPSFSDPKIFFKELMTLHIYLELDPIIGDQFYGSVINSSHDILCREKKYDVFQFEDTYTNDEQIRSHFRKIKTIPVDELFATGIFLAKQDIYAGENVYIVESEKPLYLGYFDAETSVRMMYFQKLGFKDGILKYKLWSVAKPATYNAGEYLFIKTN
jgi:hypothetical protein